MMINRKTTLRWALFALCLILVSSFVSAEWTKGTSNLVSYWTFDDANTIGSIAIGFNNTGNGTISGAFTGATGIIAEAYDFERGDLNDRVESSSTPYAFGTDDFSISLWYKPQTVSGGEIYTLFYSNDAGAGDRFIFYVTDDGTVIFFTYDGTATTAQTTEVLSAGN